MDEDPEIDRNDAYKHSHARYEIVNHPPYLLFNILMHTDSSIVKCNNTIIKRDS